MNNTRKFLVAVLFPLWGIKGAFLGGFLLLGAGGLHAQAQDTIRLTWTEEEYYYYTRTFRISATPGEQYRIDWGDGEIDTITSYGERVFSRVYSNFYKQYTLSITGFTTDCRFLRFDSSPYSLTDLYINCSELEVLDCGFAGLTTLDVSKCPPTMTLIARLNCFTLSKCYRISKHFSNPYYTLSLSGQGLPSKKAEVGVPLDFSAEALFDGIATVFEVFERDGTPTSAFLQDNGFIAFQDTGKYIIRMSNSAIKAASCNLYIDIEVVGDATLSDLSLSHGKLNPAFNNIQFHYSVEVGYDTTETAISAVAKDPNTVISGDTGLQKLAVGTNIFTVRSTLENTTHTYTIAINRR